MLVYSKFLFLPEIKIWLFHIWSLGFSKGIRLCNSNSSTSIMTLYSWLYQFRNLENYKNSKKQAPQGFATSPEFTGTAFKCAIVSLWKPLVTRSIKRENSANIPICQRQKGTTAYCKYSTFEHTNSQLHEFAVRSHTRILPFWSPDISSVCKATEVKWDKYKNLRHFNM